MPSISVAFRFHVNFYHSYRGDSLDEYGIGKDIRIIRSILDALDHLNDSGVPVRGTWDFDNYFSLERLIPAHAPDILERIRRRVAARQDEVELMSYNNGLVSAHTDDEFDRAISWAITNPNGSGIADLFDAFAPIVRPQECMLTPGQLERYRTLGLEAISLYYSALPFNGFSTFVPPLPIEQRYNPVTLRTGGSDTLTLLPAYNHGDIADHFGSLRRWVTSMRRSQMQCAEPPDLLLIIDMDADDDFWAGIQMPVLPRIFRAFSGFSALVRSVADLPYVRFVRPYDYLTAHPPVGEVQVGRDLADGSFDGYSSWAEKWDNTALWTKICEARRLAWAARAADPPGNSEEIDRLLDEALSARLIALSTTHFGLASPVMNVDRLGDAHRLAGIATQRAREAYALSRGEKRGAEPDLSEPDAPTSLTLPGVEKLRTRETQVVGTPHGFEMGVEEEWSITVSFPRVNHGSDIIRAVDHPPVSQAGAAHEYAGKLRVGEGEGRWSHSVQRVPASSALVLEVEVHYPETEAIGYNKNKADRLGRTWDHRWKEVAPCEIDPGIAADPRKPLTVWKHNFHGEVSSYRFDQHHFSRNRTIDSCNNHVTNGWIAISDGTRGLLIAQSRARQTSFAFAPMRVNTGRRRQTVRINPFGSYYGRQLSYPTAVTGFGRMMALHMADQLDSYAPSYAGKTSRFCLLLAPYHGAEPAADLQQAAMVFADSQLSVCRPTPE